MPSSQISRPASVAQTVVVNALPHPPVTAPPCDQAEASTVATLVLKDGSSYQGISFGAETKSIAGECVFQTGTCLINAAARTTLNRAWRAVFLFPVD